MVDFRIVINEGAKTYQKTIPAGEAHHFQGKKVGEVVRGETIGLQGYELKITGGSDSSGFPMRSDVKGIGKRRVLIGSPPGFHPTKDGERTRILVHGNTVDAMIAQLNMKVVKQGTKPLSEVFGGEKAEKPAGT